MRRELSVRRLALALMVAASTALGSGMAAAEEARSVLEEILTIMRQSGQITEEQKKALLQRAEQEAQQAKAERERQGQDRVSALQAGVENRLALLGSARRDLLLEVGRGLLLGRPGGGRAGRELFARRGDTTA